MPNSIYKVIQLIGSSPNSWEEAAKNAVEKAGATLEDLRVAKVIDQDVKIENGKIAAYRTQLSLSFRFHEPTDLHK